MKAGPKAQARKKGWDTIAAAVADRIEPYIGPDDSRATQTQRMNKLAGELAAKRIEVGITRFGPEKFMATVQVETEKQRGKLALTGERTLEESPTTWTRPVRWHAEVLTPPSDERETAATERPSKRRAKPSAARTGMERLVAIADTVTGSHSLYDDWVSAGGRFPSGEVARDAAQRLGDAMHTIELWRTEPTGQDVRELARRLAKAGTGLIIEFKQGSWKTASGLGLTITTDDPGKLHKGPVPSTYVSGNVQPSAHLIYRYHDRFDPRKKWTVDADHPGEVLLALLDTLRPDGKTAKQLTELLETVIDHDTMPTARSLIDDDGREPPTTTDAREQIAAGSIQ